MKILKSEQVELCCDLAERALEADGWAVDYIHNEDGDASYSEGTQDRFNHYYGLFWEALDNAKT